MVQSFYLKFQVQMKILRTEKGGHCREVDIQYFQDFQDFIINFLKNVFTRLVSCHQK